MYELKVDGVVVYRSKTFPPYPLHDVCAALARHFGVSFEHTCDGVSYSY